MRSGSAAAVLTAVSRTAGSASKVSMKSAVLISLGPIGTSALAPIIRSGTGALGSTCFWKLAGSAERGTGQAAAWGTSLASLIGAILTDQGTRLSGSRRYRRDHFQDSLPRNLLSQKLRGSHGIGGGRRKPSAANSWPTRGSSGASSIALRS